MSSVCQNCNKPLHGKYCSNCGQSADTHRIGAHFLWHDLQHGLLHVDKGIFYTTKELFTRPGHSIREFLQGKRVKHFKPLSLIIILAGIYGFLTHFFGINLLSNNIKVSGSGEEVEKAKEALARVSEWMAQHYSIVTLAQVPLFALGTYIAFRKAGYNFTEHLVINTFLAGQKLLLHIALFPLYYAFNNTSQLRYTSGAVDLTGYALSVWAVFQLFNQFGTGQRIWRTLLSLAIPLVLFFFILVIVSKIVLG